MPVRLSESKDIACLADVERSAARLLIEYFDDPKYGNHTLSRDMLEVAHQNKSLWIATQEETSVGFLAATPMDGGLHVQEISVMFEHQGKGLGRCLMKALIADARAREYPVISLTTNRVAPWNKPFYESLGFQEIGIGECSPELCKILKKEKTHHSAPDDRIAMILLL